MRWPGRMAGEVLRHAVQKPATVRYPAEPVALPPAYRGKILFHAERCVGCKLCQKDCPADALAIDKVADRRFQATFHVDRCIFCAQCVDSCNKDAMSSTAEFELAVLDRAALRVVYHAPPAPPAPPASPGTPGAQPAPPAANEPALPEPA